MSDEPKCSSCHNAIHKDQAIDHMGLRVRHRNRDDCLRTLNARLAECERSLECGHPASLLVKSLESNAQWCELCDTRDRRNDAEAMERHYKAELATEKERYQAMLSLLAQESKIADELRAEVARLNSAIANMADAAMHASKNLDAKDAELAALREVLRDAVAALGGIKSDNVPQTVRDVLGR